MKKSKPKVKHTMRALTLPPEGMIGMKFSPKINVKQGAAQVGDPCCSTEVRGMMRQFTAEGANRKGKPFPSNFQK